MTHLTQLPLPRFTGVTETHVSPAGESVVLIAPDPMAGKVDRYSVLRVSYATGKTRCIGRELSLPFARQVAMRSPSDDGKPLSEKV